MAEGKAEKNAKCNDNSKVNLKLWEENEPVRELEKNSSEHVNLNKECVPKAKLTEHVRVFCASVFES